MCKHGQSHKAQDDTSLKGLQKPCFRKPAATHKLDQMKPLSVFSGACKRSRQLRRQWVRLSLDHLGNRDYLTLPYQANMGGGWYLALIQITWKYFLRRLLA